MTQPRVGISAVVLGALDADALAAFYANLLGWTVVEDEPGGVRLRDPSGEMMMHLDIAVDDVEAAVAWAQEAGAVLAEYQPQRDVRVMLDPAGHPFCLFLGPV